MSLLNYLRRTRNIFQLESIRTLFKAQSFMNMEKASQELYSKNPSKDALKTYIYNCSSLKERNLARIWMRLFPENDRDDLKQYLK